MNHRLTRLLSYLVLGYWVLGDNLPAIGQQPKRVSRPDWSQIDTSEIFYEDAFEQALRGQWPLLDLAVPSPSTRPPLATASSSSAISQPLLIATLNQIINQLPAKVRSPRTFQGEVIEQTQRDLIVASCIFGILSQGEKNRYQSQAADAAAQCLQVAETIATMSEKSLQEVIRVTADLSEMIRGNRIFAEDGAPPEWSEVCDRELLMWRIESDVDDVLSARLAEPTDFQSSLDELDRTANLLAGLFWVLGQHGCDGTDDAGYVDFCRDAQQSSRELQAAIQRADFALSQAKFAQLKNNCTTCHEAYR